MKKTLFTGLGLILLASCQSYKKLDFSPEKILNELEAQRASQGALSELSFSRAASLMDENNLRLKQIQQRYRGLQAVADIKSPLPNPSLEAGAAFGTNLVGSSASATQPFIGLGFSIPLGPRLRRNDELNHVRALEAYNEQVLNHRQLYFDLRKSYVSLALAQELLMLQGEIRRTLELTQVTTQKLLDLGMITRLGVTAVKIQLAELKLERLDESILTQDALAELADLLVMDRDSLAQAHLAPLSQEKVQVDDELLKEKLLRNNADLARVEMSFHLADAQLRLDLANQYPDLNVGFSADQEVGEKKKTFSIPFSIELPLFDRNEQSIAASLSKREEALLEYKRVLNTKLSELERLSRQFQLSREKSSFMNRVLIPLSTANLSDAKKALKMGTINIMRYLDMVNAHQKLKLAQLKLTQAQWKRLIELEKFCGTPLIDSVDKSFPPASLKTLETK